MMAKIFCMDLNEPGTFAVSSSGVHSIHTCHHVHKWQSSPYRILMAHQNSKTNTYNQDLLHGSQPKLALLLSLFLVHIALTPTFISVNSKFPILDVDGIIEILRLNTNSQDLL